MEKKIEIPEYIRQVTLSNKRRSLYWIFDKQAVKSRNKILPASFIKPEYKEEYKKNNVFWNVMLKSMYDFKTEKGHTYLVYKATGQKVLANPRTAGTPKVVVINSQNLYSGTMNEFERIKIVTAIKESFLPYVKTLNPIKDYPIKVSLEIQDTIVNEFGGARWDLDNRGYLYFKCFMDLITTGKTGITDKEGNRLTRMAPILIDDSSMYVTGVGGLTFTPIENSKDRKLIFTITSDNREVISKNKEFYNLHSKFDEMPF